MRGWITVVLAAAGILGSDLVYAQEAAKAVSVAATAELKPDSSPDWLKKPSSSDLIYAWPRSALAKGLSGGATIQCVVNKQGLLQDCSVQSETPLGEGFGIAALTLTPTMLFKPATRNGQPINAEIIVPVEFTSPSKFNLRNSFILAEPYWSKTPSATEVMAQLERNVGDKFADGKVVFMCTLSKTTGRLKLCHVVNASEGMAQFKKVGYALTDNFQASPETVGRIKSWPDSAEALVFLSFSFPDMGSAVWGQRYLTRPVWIRAPATAPDQKLFPEDAAKAGLKSGSATVDCLVGPGGGLTQCTVVSESTPNLGLGVMAVKIAQAFATNPWTDEGLPAGGAHVRMPIKMVDAEADQAGPATSAKP